MFRTIKAFISSIILLIAISHMATGQSGISLYHLNNNTFQGNNFNPSYLPEGKLFLGLPTLSGISLDVNSRINYSSLVSNSEEGAVYDFEGIADASKANNFISLESELSTFYIGFKPTHHTAVTFFIRERVGARLFYTDDVMNLAAYGNKPFAGETIDISNSLVDARYYREYGVGIWKSIPKQNVNFGVRIKVLNGIASIISNKDLDASITLDEDYNHSFDDVSNGVLNTSGLNVLSGDGAISHLISNGNIGAGIDLGVNWKINSEISAALAVNDLGFIRWKVDPENYAIEDTNFEYAGVDLRDISDFSDAITDSLYSRLVDTTYNEAYTSGLNTSIFGSLMYNLSSTDMVTATIGSYIVQGNFRTQYALGYTKKVGRILAVSANAIRTPQQGFDFGLGTAVTFGPVQLYLSSDKLVRVWDATNTSSVDLRFGMNFIFGREKGEEEDRKDLVHPTARGKKGRMEKSDGVYSIVKKRKRRPVYNDKHKFSSK